MSKRVIIWIIVILIFGIFLGWLTGRLFYSKDPTIIEKIDTIIETKKIDSLVSVIKSKDLEIDSLKNNVKVIREIQYKDRERIKSLPISEGVALLRDNLLAYGTETTPSDTLPKEVSINNQDTLVMINDRNLVDINTAYSDLRSEIGVNEEYKKIIAVDSVILVSQDSIIVNKNSIISKQNANIGTLEKALKKEKRKKTKNTLIIGTIAVILGALNFVH